MHARCRALTHARARAAKIDPKETVESYLKAQGISDPQWLSMADAGYANTLCNTLSELPLKETCALFKEVRWHLLLLLLLSPREPLRSAPVVLTLRLLSCRSSCAMVRASTAFCRRGKRSCRG